MSLFPQQIKLGCDKSVGEVHKIKAMLVSFKAASYNVLVNSPIAETQCQLLQPKGDNSVFQGFGLWLAGSMAEVSWLEKAAVRQSGRVMKGRKQKRGTVAERKGPRTRHGPPPGHTHSHPEEWPANYQEDLKVSQVKGHIGMQNLLLTSVIKKQRHM